MKESELVRKVLAVLNSLPECKAIKVHGSPYARAGTPDIIGCCKGRMFALEVKMAGRKPTKIQERELAAWGAAGAIAGTFYSDDSIGDLVYWLEKGENDESCLG